MPRKAEGKSSSSVTATTAIPERSPDVRLRIWASQNSTEIVDGRGLEIAALDDAEMCISIDAKCRFLVPNPKHGHLPKGKAELALGRLIDAAQSFHQGLQLAPDHQELELGARREEWVVQPGTFKNGSLAAGGGSPGCRSIQGIHCADTWDLVFAARLGLEHLFRTLEDPQKTTDAFVESNAAVLDQQLGLLAQTLHVNTSVLFESPRLCDAYEQIVRACSQLVTGAPSAFSRRLAHAEQIVQGLCLAVRIGWHVHHGIVAPVKERRSEEWGGGGWERRRMRMAVTE
ncbi:unnamed protein product [Durusdinium trenchii]|uniref:KIF-binding protein n=1 Tax=Durusdinium trenchii TaxID=1381693 RepID=A0ABP0P8M6_9DINO